jgi:hypothetical protein
VKSNLKNVYRARTEEERSGYDMDLRTPCQEKCYEKGMESVGKNLCLYKSKTDILLLRNYCRLAAS